MMSTILCKTDHYEQISNDNYCTATLQVSACGREVSSGAWGEHGGCVFKVGNDMYFVPTQQVAEDDMLYITCDAQKIEGPVEVCRSHLALGEIANHEVEDAIVDHLHTALDLRKQGETFVITRDRKTFKL